MMNRYESEKRKVTKGIRQVVTFYTPRTDNLPFKKTMPITSLPNEVLTQILQAIDNQPDRCSALFVCRNWFEIVLPILYSTPILTNERAVDRFLVAPAPLRLLARQITLPACEDDRDSGI